ncbi:hypothetical protein VULLAG_LOCUS17745 [Vulpes lagopus]
MKVYGEASLKHYPSVGYITPRSTPRIPPKRTKVLRWKRRQAYVRGGISKGVFLEGR